MCSSSAVSREPGSNPPSSRPKSASRPRPRRRLFTVDDLHDKFRIGPGAAGAGGVVKHALSVAGRLADAYVSGNQRFEDRLIEILSDLGDDFVSQVQTRVVHRQHNPPNLKPVVLARFCLPGKLYDLRKPI